MVFSLVWRIGVCLVLGYSLSWLTIRSESLLPATLAHMLYNVLLGTRSEGDIAGDPIIRVALWAIVAMALFRYWPPAEHKADIEATPPLERA